MLKWFHGAVLAAAALITPITHAQGQGEPYPSRPVRVVVPFAPGTAVDLMARAISEGLSQELGAPFVVENRPGASGVVGTDAVAKAVADGYTLLFTSPAHYLNTSMYKRLPYDAVKDFTPVTKLGNTQLVMITSKSSPHASVKELVAAAKAAPGKLTYSSAGNGSTTQLCAALFNAMAGTEITHVPYKSGGQAVVDVLGGQVSMTCTAVATALGHIQSGAAKALGVTGTQRFGPLAQVPTIAEAGVPGYAFVSWNGVYARAGTSPQIVSRLNDAMVRIASRPEFQAKLQAQGVDVDVWPAAVFARNVPGEVDKWAKVAAAAGLMPE